MVYAALALVGTAAFLVNVPLGMWRETTRRFSPAWFVAIHLSVPLVIALRMVNHLPLIDAPLLLFLAVAGQVAGSRGLRRHRAARSTDPAA